MGGVLLGLLGGYLIARGRHEPVVTTGDITRITTEDGLEVQPAISPNGAMVAYAAGSSMHVRLFLRGVDGGHAVPLTSDSTTNQQHPQWSPSGKSILFLADGEVDTVAGGLGVGASGTLVGGGDGAIVSATWSPDGHRIAFARKDSLWTYTIANGERHLVTTGPMRECAWAPRGDLVACTSPRDFSAIGTNMGNTGPARIIVAPAGGGEPTAITDSSSMNGSPAWSPDGRRLYFVSNRNHQRDIYYVALSVDGHPAGEPHRLTTALNVASLSLAADGRHLAYSVYVPQSNIWSVPILPNAVATSAAATQVTFGHQLVESMSIAPDGKTLFYDSDRDGNSDVWRLKPGDRQPEAMTRDPADEFGGALSPDGRRLAFYSYRDGSGRGLVMVKTMDGGPMEQVSDAATNGLFPEWNPDGSSLYWICGRAGSQGGVCRGARDQAGHWKAAPSGDRRASWSPDGRWATTYRRGVHDTVWIYRADSATGRMLYTATSPTDPRAGQLEWARDSRALLFKSHDPEGRARFWSLSIDGGAPRLIARLDDLSHPSYRGDFTTDGNRIYFAVNDRQSDISVVELIEH